MIQRGDVSKMDGCVVRDERGVALAVLHVEDGVISVKKTVACSIGTLFYIMSRLREQGYEVV